SKPLEPFYEREDVPGPHVQSDDELLGAAKERGTSTFHPSGTCRMGPVSDPATVVDDHLRVHGFEGLRPVDASLMPTMLSANPNAATMTLADKASDMIRGREAMEAVVVAGRRKIGSLRRKTPNIYRVQILALSSHCGARYKIALGWIANIRRSVRTAPKAEMINSL
ncbi:MAG: GMC oxidoreductase, partial [Hyphomicrobium sp.]